MKPFTRVPQPNEVASITWKRGGKQKRNLFTCGSRLPPSAKTSSEPPRRVPSRQPPVCPGGSGGCRGGSGGCPGTHRDSTGGAPAAPPARAPSPSPRGRLRHRREHRGGAAGTPARQRQRYLGQAARLLRVAAAQHPLQLVHGSAPRPPGRPDCPALLFPSSPSPGTTSPGSHRAHLRAAGTGSPAGRGGAQAAGGCSPDGDGACFLPALSNPLLQNSFYSQRGFILMPPLWLFSRSLYLRNEPSSPLPDKGMWMQCPTSSQNSASQVVISVYFAQLKTEL